MVSPATISELQDAVRGGGRWLPRGGGSKPALSAAPAGVSSLDVSALCGVVEYEPAEYTITALAGTRLADVVPILKEHGQYLPFDPLLVEQGATLGGTVAAGAAGPGRYRYGGVRDFLLGVRFVDGEGRLVRSGGKVVKNAAGFDIAKLMVGSLGRLGVLVELTFKVFPVPPAYASLRLQCDDLPAAMAAFYRVFTSQLDIHSLDLVATEQGGWALWVRLAGGRPAEEPAGNERQSAGLDAALPGRLARVQGLIGGEAVEGDQEAAAWRGARELGWAPAGWSLVKVPLTPGRIAALEETLAGLSPRLLAATRGGSGGRPAEELPGNERRPAGREVRRRYSAGGQVAWLAFPESPAWLDAPLAGLELGGLVYRAAGDEGYRLRLGRRTGEVFEERVRQALDPGRRFAAGEPQ